ncbi:hypothetical protein T484DRAFT_1872159, partial [Baffinella frigidus]
EASQTPDGSPPPAHGYWASRFPRKVCAHVLSKFSNVAFLAFNSRGIPGSSRGDPPARSEDPPTDFTGKTLDGDMEDVAGVVGFAAGAFPGARIVVCGMSTGAFLALAFAAKREAHPACGIAGCFVLACVAGGP